MLTNEAFDNEASLFDRTGRRKYLSVEEWRRFLDAASDLPLPTRTLCRVLAYTGCRISEALSLTVRHIDADTGCLILRTLKRRKLCFRAVPIPPALIAELKQLGRGGEADACLWTCCRQTAWRHVKAVMDAAGIAGPQASPKGLRHRFGVAAAEENVPASLTQRWMGHARPETTAIYQYAVGREERAFAQRMWRQRAQ